MKIRLLNNLSVTNQLLLLFCFISLTIRLLFISYGFPDEDFLKHSDQSKYLKLSEVLSEKLAYDQRFGFVRLPIYPLFISLVSQISEKLYFIILIQHLIGALTIMIIFKYKLNEIITTVSVLLIAKLPE